ncbi:FV3-083R, partial [Symbiodinium pilosum]
ALGTLNTAQLPVGAYTGARLAAWISSNYASATYVEAQNSIEVASDGNRHILSDVELRDLFPNQPGYPQGAYATSPQSINHLLGGSYIDGLSPSRELGNAAHILAPLGTDIICKVIIDKGVGHVMKDQTDDGHLVELRGPITLRTLNFRITDLDGDEVNTRGKAKMPDEHQPDQAEEAGGAAEAPAAATEPVDAGDLPPVPPAGPPEPVVAVPAAEGPGGEPLPPAGAAAAAAAEAPREDDSLAGAAHEADQPAEPLRAAGRGCQHGCLKGTMMPLERRNEAQMLRSFWKQYPSYRVQPLLYKRYNELVEARAFNEWLENRRIRKEGEEYTDAVGRLTDTVNRRLPQLRYAPAERAGVRR